MGILTFKQCKTILDTYLDFYPDDNIDINILDHELKEDLDKNADEGILIPDDKLYYSSGFPILEITTYYPELTLTNDRGLQHTIYGVYFRTSFPNCEMTLGRNIFTNDEVRSGYIHSHVLKAGSITALKRFCRGNSDTPINRIINKILHNEYTDYGLLIQSLIIETERMIRIESNEGIPYISFTEIGKDVVSSPIEVIPTKSRIISGRERDSLIKFIKYYCSLGLDKFYYDGRNYQLRASDSEFITRVTKAAKKYKYIKNSLLCRVYYIKGLYYYNSNSNVTVSPSPGTKVDWAFKGERPVIKILNYEEDVVREVSILNIDYIGIIYNYLLNLINGVYATDKYKDCYCSRIRKIETENIKKL